MHIQDGFLPTATWGAGWVTAAALTAATLPKLKEASAPRVAMMTSAFFVASLLSFPIFGTSIHLCLLGLCGIVLGRAAFPAILVGLTLQYFLFAHGGFSTIGVNATTMGCGALLAAAVYHSGSRPSVGRAAVATAAGTLLALILYGAAMLTTDQALTGVVYAVFVVHVPLLLVETVVTVMVVRFLLRVQPELVGGGPPDPLRAETDPSTAETGPSTAQTAPTAQTAQTTAEASQAEGGTP